MKKIILGFLFKTSDKSFLRGMINAKECNGLKNILLICTFISVMITNQADAQNVSLRSSSMELTTDDPMIFARSLQASSSSKESVQALCAVMVYDSEGQHWGTYVSKEPAKVGSGNPANCWTSDMRNILPGRQLGRTDQVLPNGLLINSSHVMAQPAPVTAEDPLPPDLFASLLMRNNPNVESLAEDIGGYPPQMPKSATQKPRWVVASFLLIPLSESGRELSRDFQSTSVNLLLGKR